MYADYLELECRTTCQGGNDEQLTQDTQRTHHRRRSIVEWLLNSPKAGLIWLLPRLWLGYRWIDAEAYTCFGKAVAYGELLVGIALVLGAFTGIAAFFGALMNWNFMMAGSASTNPLLFVIAIGLILAWKVAGYYGADYFLLRWLQTPRSAKKASSNDPELVPA